MEQMGLGDDLYIKMNSRGKPLSSFENFKARFEQVIEISCPTQVGNFARKVDGAWSDMLWPYHGGSYIVDNEFLRYFHFVTEICVWRAGLFATEEIGSLAESIYGPECQNAAAHLDLLFNTMDTWVDQDIDRFFEDIFRSSNTPQFPGNSDKVLLFSQSGDCNLFKVCCQNYGGMRGANRLFSWSQTLLLYAVVLHRLHDTGDFLYRIRVLRNLIEASGNEMRLERMPALIADVERIVVEGLIEEVTDFNRAQVEDEVRKAEFCRNHPHLKETLQQLEDHPILHGCLVAFELNAEEFSQQAEAFQTIFSEINQTLWPSLTGALLACGDYSQWLNTRMIQFGSGSTPAVWRELLTRVGYTVMGRTRSVLGNLLNQVANTPGDLNHCLVEIRQNWVIRAHEQRHFDWQYYFIKYDVMRSGRSGIYAGAEGSIGYSLCMLDKQRVSSWYRDPYLLAIHQESGVGEICDSSWPWFIGYETQPRWMRLSRSGTGLRCLQEGLALEPPSEEFSEIFNRVCLQHGIGEDHLLRVPQVESQGHMLDTQDRVQMGAGLLRDLVEAGL
jgi:hypothetical protein